MVASAVSRQEIEAAHRRVLFAIRQINDATWTGQLLEQVAALSARCNQLPRGGSQMPQRWPSSTCASSGFLGGRAAERVQGFKSSPATSRLPPCSALGRRYSLAHWPISQPCRTQADDAPRPTPAPTPALPRWLPRPERRKPSRTWPRWAPCPQPGSRALSSCAPASPPASNLARRLTAPRVQAGRLPQGMARHPGPGPECQSGGRRCRRRWQGQRIALHHRTDPGLRA